MMTKRKSEHKRIVLTNTSTYDNEQRQFLQERKKKDDHEKENIVLC